MAATEFLCEFLILKPGRKSELKIDPTMPKNFIGKNLLLAAI